MKRRLMTLVAALAMCVPAAALAQGHGGGRGFSGGRAGGYSGGRSLGGAARGFEYRGGYHDRYFRGGFGYRSVPNRCGYYDSWGRSIPYAGCYVPPYGY